MIEEVECIVVGAGVVGLAIARRLAMDGREVLVLESADGIGTETSSRNSEVIHGGLYYPRDQLKTQFCVAGRKALYAYCEERAIAHRRIGKLIVATNEGEIAFLRRIEDQAKANGVEDIRRVETDEARRLEPEVNCVAALMSPSTGIIDSHALVLSLQGDATAHGANFSFRTPALGAIATESGFVVDAGGKEAYRLACQILVNAAGLSAQSFAASVEGLPKQTIPRLYPAKGNYFTMSGRSPFGHLIYPVPVPGSLGIHVTLDLAGQVRFGPDVEWVESIDYKVDPACVARFYSDIRRYYRGLADGALIPGYSGIRPKLAGPGMPAADFSIQGAAGHGLAGLINLYGIESPGLTACLAIADHVGTLVSTETGGRRRRGVTTI